MTWAEFWCFLWKHDPGDITTQAFHIQSTCNRCGAKLMLDSGFGWSRMDE